MKKNMYILLGMMLIFGLSYIIRNNFVKEEKIVVAEVTHSAFYTPFYVALEEGYFADNGLDIELILTSGANNVVASVLSGDVQIGLCGPEATIYVYNEKKDDYVASFDGITKKDGQFIVGRNKEDNFTLESLEGKEVLAGRPGGMPIVNFYEMIKGIDVNVNDTVDFANLTSAFIAGAGDYVNLFEPNATKVEQMGYGYVLGSIGAYSKEVPYTAFNAKISYIKNNKDIIDKFKDALNKGLTYTLENDANVLAETIKDMFPDTSLNDLTLIIDRYKKADVWLNNTYISKDMFINLEDMMIDNNLLDDYVSYEELIINE